MKNPLACKSFSDHTDDETDHGRTTVEELNLLQLIFVNGASCFALEPGVVSGSAFHGGHAIETNCNRDLTLGSIAFTAFSKSLVFVASGTARGTLGKSFRRIREQCSARVHKK